MSKKKIYYLLYVVALFFILFALGSKSLNFPPDTPIIFLTIGVIILLINLVFFKFW